MREMATGCHGNTQLLSSQSFPLFWLQVFFISLLITTHSHQDEQYVTATGASSLWGCSFFWGLDIFTLSILSCDIVRLPFPVLLHSFLWRGGHRHQLISHMWVRSSCRALRTFPRDHFRDFSSLTALYNTGFCGRPNINKENNFCALYFPKMFAYSKIIKDEWHPFGSMAAHCQSFLAYGALLKTTSSSHTEGVPESGFHNAGTPKIFLGCSLSGSSI